LLQSWAYSLTFPLGVAILLYIRPQFGYYWPLPPYFGLGIVAIGIVVLLLHLLFPVAAIPAPLKRQAVYSDIWTIFLGVWFLFGRALEDFSLIALIAVACALWPLSHRQLLILKKARAPE
jgi:hypothetical protein